MVNVELAKKSLWIVKNYNIVSDPKYKNTAAGSKKRLEQLSKQLKVYYNPNRLTRKLGKNNFIITHMCI